MKFSRFDRTTLMAVAVLVLGVMLTAAAVILQPQRELTSRIAYLAPSRSPYQVWWVDPAQPDSAEQLTFAENGVYDFGVSADGEFIAYSQYEAGSDHADLWLLDLQTRSTRQLTDCITQNAICTNPAWRSDGQVIAYQRQEQGDIVPRIWLLDLTTTPPTTVPLFQVSDVYGTDPQWSRVGDRLAFYDALTQGVLIYNFTASDTQLQLQAVEFGNGSSGALSPNGAYLVYPKLLIGSPTRAVFQLVNLDSGEFRSLTDESELTEDRFVAWHPDGVRVVITRRYLDQRFTEGDQIYEVNTQTGSITPLISDPNYQHSTPSWNLGGTQLVLHRYALADPDALPEIWMYDAETRELNRIVEDGFYPRWINLN